MTIATRYAKLLLALLGGGAGSAVAIPTHLPVWATAIIVGLTSAAAVVAGPANTPSVKADTSGDALARHLADSPSNAGPDEPYHPPVTS